MKNVNEVIRDLLKSGAKRIDNAVVKTVSVSRQEKYDRVALSLTKPVKGYVKDEDGNFAEGETRVIFVSSYSLGAILAENEDTAFAKRILMAKPNLLELVLSYAKISIIQEHVNANNEYVNPFAYKPKPTMLNNDNYINHVIKIELSNRGMRAIDKLEDKIFDNAFEFRDIYNEEEL